MSEVHYDITAELEVVTPLHVGSGRTRPVARVKGKEGQGSNDAPRVAAIQLDHAGLPYLPASTQKGILLDLARRRYGAGDRVEALFGQVKDDGTGRIGAVLFRGSSMDAKRAPSTADLPYAQDAGVAYDAGGLPAGVFVAGRTRIDRASGTVDDGKLFFQEMVAPGAVFPLRLVLTARRAQDEGRDLLADLLGLLDGLTAEPAAFGKGSGQALGALRVVAGSLSVRKTTLTPDLTLTTSDVTDVVPSPATDSARAVFEERLELVCEGPFMIIDSSRTRKKKQTNDPRDREPQLTAARIRERLPLLMGPGLKGPLRARAAWLESLAVHRAQTDTPTPVDPKAVDNPDRVLHAAGEIEQLTPVERLFGVTGFRGLLSIVDLQVTEAEPWEVTSVKLDRFSGGPIDNALFTSATFVGTRITVTLRLASRGTTRPSEADIELAKQLVGDIRVNGLMLGHGGNKGFGWFEALRESA